MVDCYSVEAGLRFSNINVIHILWEDQALNILRTLEEHFLLSSLQIRFRAGSVLGFSSFK